MSTKMEATQYEAIQVEIGPARHSEVRRMNAAQTGVIVSVVSVARTLDYIPAGSSVVFKRRELGSEGTVWSAVTRANQSAGRKEFSVRYVNDYDYEITHHKFDDEEA